MHSIAMFNNKGGVGKTTLVCNLAAFLATKEKKKVLVVDCDPQCNASQLIMGEEYASDFYWNLDSNRPSITTIREVLQPIEDGDSDIDTSIKPILSSTNRFNVDLIPGHPSFSIVEDRLGAAWHDLLAGDIGGLRKNNWNTELCSFLSTKYDFIFYDLGPSLSSINRTVLIGCDFFMTPIGADIFSILGIKNISKWILHWSDLYKNSIKLANKRASERLDKYNIVKSPKVLSGYLGYTLQQYITKTKGGERRPTKAYENILEAVPSVINEYLGQFFAPNILNINYARLGELPHLYSLIPLAQSVAAPILDLKSTDGLVGFQYRQRDDYETMISSIAQNLKRNLGING